MVLVEPEIPQNTGNNDYFVFGSETRGLPRELVMNHLDSSIRIPMWGTKPRSLNLSNAAAIVLY